MVANDGLNFATLLASSVHDMKNNVGMMIHQLTQLSEKLSEDIGEVKELDVIGIEANQLNQSLIQLLAIYKLEQNLYSVPSQEVFLDEFCEDFQAAHQAMLSAFGVELIIDCEDGEQEWVFDADLLQSVLSTLLCNVFQLKQKNDDVGVVKLCTSVQTIDQQQYLKVSLDDDGPGFDSEHWGRFVPEQKGVQFATGNSGLGLYFSHLVAEHHHSDSVKGFLQLGESEKLGGASVSFFLPVLN